MAIGAIQGAAGFYDINRDMYNGTTASEAYEREMHYRRHQEAEYRRMQASRYGDISNQQQMAYIGERQKQVPVKDPKDPLAFLSKTDNKLLLTGEAT
jgi:hypothetical protein